MTRKATIAFAFATLVIASTACGTAGPKPSASALGDDAITVGSFNFPESNLLATIYGRAMRAGGYKVNFAFDIGPRELVEPALSRGLIEFLPEYAGTALLFLSINDDVPSSDAGVNHRRLVKRLRGTPVAALAAAPARDANGFAVLRRTASKYGLSTISDLRPIASKLTFGGPPECPNRPFCVLGLKQKYGLRIKKFLPTDAGGPLTQQALHTGQVDVGLVFTSDPGLIGDDLVELRDDLRLQPAENVTPLVHREVLRRWGPKLVRLVDGVSRRLTTEGLRNLNREVVVEKKPPAVVADEWLERVGIR